MAVDNGNHSRSVQNTIIELPYSNRRSFGRKIALIFTVVVFLAVILIGGILILTKKVDCQAVLDKSTPMLQKNQYEQTYKLLKLDENSCGQTSKLVKNQISSQIVEYNFQLAVSASQTSRVDEAKRYARETLKLYDNMVGDELEKVNQSTALRFDMKSIAEGGKYTKQRVDW